MNSFSGIHLNSFLVMLLEITSRFIFLFHLNFITNFHTVNISYLLN